MDMNSCIYEDLTQMVENNMPVYPGTQEVIVKKANTIKEDGFAEKLIMMCSHTGTHIDAPAHMLDKGKTLDEFPVDFFFGKALIADFSNGSLSDDIIHRLGNVDFLLLSTNWSNYWNSPQYFKDFPFLDSKTMNRVLDYSLKGIGIDAISIDPINSTFDNHMKVFNKNMVIIENMKHMSHLSGQIVDLVALPLNIAKSDGAAARVIVKSGHC